MKIYCQKCGSATPYTSQKPNFCQGCGESLGSVKKPEQAKAGESPVAMETVETEEESFETPNMDKLDVEIEIYKPNITIGQLANNPQMGFSRDKPKKQSRKNFLEQWKNEAGGNPHKGG